MRLSVRRGTPVDFLLPHRADGCAAKELGWSPAAVAASDIEDNSGRTKSWKFGGRNSENS